MPAAACARSCRRWGSRGAPARSRHDRREAMGAAAQARVGPAPLVRERNPGRRGAADGGAPPRRVPALPGRDRHLPAAGRDPPADPGDRADGPSRPARPADGADRGRGAGQPPRLARRPAGPGARPRLPGPLDAAARPRRARRAVAPPRRRDGSLRPLAPATGGSRSRARVSDPLRERSGTGGRGPVAARLRRKDNGAGGPRSAPRYPRPDRLRPLRARGVHRGGPRRARSPGEGVGAPARPAPGEPGRAGGRTAVNLQRFRGPRGEVLALLLAFALGCAGVRTPPATTASAAADQGSGLATSHQVMVTLKPAPPTIWTKTTYEIAQDYQLRTVFAWTMVSLNEQCIVFEIPRNRSQEEILRRLRADPRVGTAQPIATFDTGVDVSHPDLRGRIARVGNFVEHGEQEFTNDIHGTAVVGVIAAETNNQVGIVGVAPQAEIYALKACWPKAPGTREAVCDSYTLARAIDFAIAQGVQILNFSLGGPHDPLLARLIGTALQRGIVVVAADPGDSQRSFPASLPGVIAVLGVDQAVPGAPQPRAGPPDVGAPSVDILSTVPHGSYDFFSGSSLAEKK